MKKKVVLLTALLCISMTFSACGSSKSDSTADTTEETTEESAEDNIPVVDKTLDELGIDTCVTLGEYKGLELEKVITTVTDTEIDSQVSAKLTETAEEVDTVQEGDIANIDYEGKVDGEVFDGGSSTGFNLTIGSGQFIDGFESGLVGAKKGQTLDLNLTFPDPYSSEDLAGKDVVFTVTVNSIKRPLKEATDEWAKANTDYQTVDEYKESIRTELQESYDASADSTLESTAWQTVVENSTVLQYPQDMIDTNAKSYKKQMETYASYYGMEFSEFLEAQNMTEEGLEEYAQQYAKSICGQQLLLKAIIEKEGFTTDDDEYKETLDSVVSTSGYESYEALTEVTTAEDIEQTVMLRRVLKLIADNAKVTETTEKTTTE